MFWLTRLGIPALMALIAFGFGSSFITTYQFNAQEVIRLQKEVDLNTGRNDSYRRMIDRRDAAIEASQCKDKIQYWVKHPDEIPKPFNPFNQLDPQNLK